jgi:hypothetical protein
MKKQYPHTAAAHLMINNALPTPEEIDAMSPADLAVFLSSQGVDVAKFQTEINEFQKQLTGKLSLAHARKQRLAEAAKRVEVGLSHITQDQMISELLKKYGSYEEMPLAARNHKSWNREDWESLYRDTFLGRHS